MFRDPTRSISLPSLDRLPQPLLSDQVAGLLQRAGTEAARLAVALVAIHAATTASLAKIKLADLDLASARLTVKNRREQRVIYLDDVTLEVLSRWLRYRHERWPASPNPLPLRHPADRRRHRPGQLHLVLDPVRAARDPPGIPAAGPHPRLGPPHRRPSPPHPGLRHLRHHRAEVRARRPPGQAVRHPEVTPVIFRPRHPARRSGRDQLRRAPCK